MDRGLLFVPVMHVTKPAWIVLALSVSASACTASYGMSGRTTPPPPRRVRVAGPPPPPPPSSGPVGHAGGGPSYGPGEDRHWFTADDYLVTREPETRPSRNLKLAKLLAPASEATKSEAQFLVFDGRELWTSSYYRSRVADANELAVGMRALCFHPATYRSGDPGPRDKQDARTHPWVMAPVTDTSNLYKGTVSIGRHACPIHAVRLPIR